MRGLSRREFLNRTRVFTPVDDALKMAYEEWTRKEWEKTDRSPHGKPWFTSFHGSAFPMSDRNCGRKAMYTMMDIPNPQPFSPEGMAIMDAGTDIERRTVEKLHAAGILLSAPPHQKRQSGFEDPDTWLTGSLDAAILPAGWNRPHLLEIKGKDDDVIWQMKKGERSYEPQHRNQLFAYMYGARKFRSLILPGHDDLGEVQDGSVVYISRNRPRNICEFYFKYDEDVVQEALSVLEEWRNDWLEGVLPSRDPSWKWTDDPCKWCDHKKTCKQDIKDDVISLEDSSAIDFAKKHSKSYSYAEKRDRIAQRWGLDG